MFDLFIKALAEADSTTQAIFFNDFYRLLKVRCQGKHETQICYIADDLDENGRELFHSLNEFAKLAVESRAKIETGISELHRTRHELEKEIAELVESRKALECPE